MLATLLSATWLLAKSAPLAVELPPGSSIELHDLVQKIADDTAAGNWTEAEALCNKLPSYKPEFMWDDSQIPEHLRDQIQDTRSIVVNEMASRILNYSVKATTSANIVFRYADVPSYSLTTSTEPGKPWLTMVFPLVRKKPNIRAVEKPDIVNDVQFAIYRAAGLAPSNIKQTIMGRSDDWGPNQLQTIVSEYNLARHLIDISDNVRTAVKTKAGVTIGLPKCELPQTNVNLGTVLQGDVCEFEFPVKNTGTSLLKAIIRPDCGCILADKAIDVKPGQTAMIHGTIDTMEYKGDLQKAIVVISNDPTNAYQDVSLKVGVKRRYQFILPPGRTVIFDGHELETDVYLIIAEGMMSSVKRAEISGTNGNVVVQKWKGNITDPDTGEQLKGVFGYKLHAKMAAPAVPGRVPISLALETNDEKFLVLRTAFYVQKGIVVLPDTARIGDVSNVPAEGVATLLVTRPGKPFNILSVKSSAPSVSATAKFARADNPGDYIVTLSYNGKGKVGTLLGEVTITTNDPKQPVIKIPFRGVVH